MNLAELCSRTSDLDTGEHNFGNAVQQAVEKAGKALLGWHGKTYSHDHAIAPLFERITVQVTAVPVHFARLERLTPYAKGFRYEMTPLQPLPRAEYLRLGREFLSWTRSCMPGWSAPPVKRPHR